MDETVTADMLLIITPLLLRISFLPGMPELGVASRP
jgi:hypothetical protein